MHPHREVASIGHVDGNTYRLGRIIVGISFLRGGDGNGSHAEYIEVGPIKLSHLLVVQYQCYRQATAGQYIQRYTARIAAQFGRSVEFDLLMGTYDGQCRWRVLKQVIRRSTTGGSNWIYTHVTTWRS